MAWIAGASALAVLVPLLAFAVGVSGGSCTSCHDRDPKAAHASVPCSRCHAAGIAGRLGSGVHVVGSVAALLPIVEAPEPSVRIGNSTCLRCHGDVEGGVVEAGGLRMDHRSCLAGRQSCSECHGAALHPDAPGPARAVQMDACLACHGRMARPEGCELCHTGKREGDLAATSWSVTHGPNWRTTHGAGDLGTCAFCHHERGSCSRCHLDMPHPEEWAGIHGEGVDAGRKACLTCHKTGFCDACHGIAMPHPSSWLKRHPSLTEGYDDPSCVRCHVRDDCDACHVAHTHPGRIRGKVTSR